MFAVGNDEYETGLGAKLAATKQERCRKILRNRLAALAERARKHHNGIHTSHFGVDRDRRRPFSCNIKQRAASALRARESDRMCERMGYEPRAQLVAAALQQGEQTCGQFTQFDGSGDRLPK